MSAADNTGKRGTFFLSFFLSFFFFFIRAVGCQSELMDPLHKRGSVSPGPSLPWGGWALSQIDGAEWQPERERWDAGLLPSSLQQRIETEGRLHPLLPSRILSIALHLDLRFFHCPHTNCPNKKEV